MKVTTPELYCCGKQRTLDLNVANARMNADLLAEARARIQTILDAYDRLIRTNHEYLKLASR